MGVKFTVDSDGDLEYKMDGKGWSIYIIFAENRSGKIWNLQMHVQFGTKKSRYYELVEYANSWNSKHKLVEVSMIDRDSLSVVLDYPVQYGFNPDEFEENVMGIFEMSLREVADETYPMRR